MTRGEKGRGRTRRTGLVGDGEILFQALGRDHFSLLQPDNVHNLLGLHRGSAHHNINIAEASGEFAHILANNKALALVEEVKYRREVDLKH